MKSKEIVSQSPMPSSANSKPDGLKFSDAMQAVMGGGKVRRIEWADPEEHCLLKDNFLSIYKGGKFHTWIVSEGDMLAIDWVVIK